MPITPKTGSLFHAESHMIRKSNKIVPKVAREYIDRCGGVFFWHC